ncbi:GMP synthase [glutamine-hydrolyzing] [Stieleria maiorica]|uniref:GMP synthase [glutamine-hydrolyzing] n=1 Tax=Stieleria maiorica TaxID=2795974 RepID=A0A5B9M9I8_9BACT|nr:type 1 glutamine amidotransferase [Stieleria maiorica]QEF97941.1 GMP synthase [glutamine-hydrolyzing] [Stieleria maiorica]
MDRFLLLQIRNADDPMRTQEIECFARALQCDPSQIAVHDLLAGPPTVAQLDAVDVVLLGGSGDYSVAAGGEWLPPALAAMWELYELAKPTFASCWGFQAMAKALGGEVVTDASHAELGSIEVRLTQAGREDPLFGPLFGPLGNRFLAPMGHQDCVVTLPPQAILLASSEKVQNQAFRVKDRPIYGTQFHPELDRHAFIQRVHAYPQYVESITGDPLDVFEAKVQDTPATDQLLRRFMQLLRHA